jgi:hypothetical protein
VLDAELLGLVQVRRASRNLDIALFLSDGPEED